MVQWKGIKLDLLPKDTQEYGMDYEEIVAPMAKVTIVRTLIVFVSIFQWKIFQMDV